ncbi:MAG: DUF1566 domain-containing protein [Deltaproteobacteria bacterium]|nr:DUF1566 domain-containing protein [Deltaproteobacteria bacterium]
MKTLSIMVKSLVANGKLGIGLLLMVFVMGCFDLPALPNRPDAATDKRPAMTDCGGGKYDQETGLCWENPARGDHGWTGAISYCEELEAGGYTDWRLPTINELSSLLRGCSSSDCPLSDPDVLNADIGESPDCEKCDNRKGPGNDGCYWSADFDDMCDYEPYWSSSQDKSYDNLAWNLAFDDGGFSLSQVTRSKAVRCVRSDGDTDTEDSGTDSSDTDTVWCSGWYDEKSHLCWEDPPGNMPDAGTYNYSDADEHCKDMDSSWHIPSIEELRSLVRNCSASEWNLLSDQGGACQVSNDCNSVSCRDSSCEAPCEDNPDCYWDSELSGSCSGDGDWNRLYWSSINKGDSNNEAWTLSFYNGDIVSRRKDYDARIRCTMSKPTNGS